MMKTPGMAHQIEALTRMIRHDHFALLMEQGTGKTWCFLADAASAYSRGKINALLVVAPKGVHTNWVRIEIPRHMRGPVVTVAWSSGMGKRARDAAERELLRPRGEEEVPPLRILATTYDALCTKDGFEFARRFLNATRATMVLDESRKIKNPSALRTHRVMALRPLAEMARIGDGTPLPNAPLDIFSQMEFLEHGLLGTTSHRAFTAEFAHVLPQTSHMMQRLIQRNPKAAYAQIIEKDAEGRPRYRNLDKLHALVARHSFRVRKRDCLDLPEKIYKMAFFDLTAAQRRMYESMENDFRVQLDSGELAIVSRLASLMKLQQITSGFMHVDGEARRLLEENPRLDALLEAAEEINGQFIVWARFREEMSQIEAALREAGIACAQYHGGTSVKARGEIVDAFQRGELRAFIGQQAAGGSGLTLTAAETVVYYSNTFSLDDRLQSEDRAHRIGTRSNVVYIDVAAEGTIDEDITRALQRKSNVADAILEGRGLSLGGAVLASAEDGR